MPQVGFEPTVSLFERAETVHALDPRRQCDRLNLNPTSQKSRFVSIKKTKTATTIREIIDVRHGRVGRVGRLMCCCFSRLGSWGVVRSPESQFPLMI
jgi:hypothetical protein